MGRLSDEAIAMSDQPSGERRLISIISSSGKSAEQLKTEAHQALQKYFDANPESRPPNYPADDGY